MPNSTLPAEILTLAQLMRQSRAAGEDNNRTKEELAMKRQELAMRTTEHQAQMEKFDLEKMRATNEERYLESVRPTMAAFQEAQSQRASIEANTSRWQAQREQAANNYARFEVARSAGRTDEAWKIAQQFYNDEVFDGQTLQQGPNGQRLLVNSETGEATPANMTLDQVAESWTGYISANPAEFYRQRKNEELTRYNANLIAPLEAMHNPESWYLDDNGNRLMRVAKTDVKTGKKSIVFTGDNGQVITDGGELAKLGFKPMKTQESLLQQDLFRIRQQYDAETDPKKKAELEGALGQKQSALQFAEAVKGLSIALGPQELAQVDNTLKGQWKMMGEDQQLEHGTYEAFQEAAKPALVAALREEKANARVSGQYGLSKSNPEITPKPGAYGNWKDYLPASTAPVANQPPPVIVNAPTLPSQPADLPLSPARPPVNLRDLKLESTVERLPPPAGPAPAAVNLKDLSLLRATAQPQQSLTSQPPAPDPQSMAAYLAGMEAERNRNSPWTGR